MRPDFLAAVQWHVSRLSVGASAARGQGAPGLVDAARTFLAEMPLQRFGVEREMRFRSHLDALTEELKGSLPRKGRNWGIARKLLNIFLRNALYDKYLSAAWKLDRSEQWLEVPLDRIVADKLRQYVPVELPDRTPLSRWLGVKHLKPAFSEGYQDAIRELAAKKGVAPVHMDIYWWSPSRTGGSSRTPIARA